MEKQKIVESVLADIGNAANTGELLLTLIEELHNRVRNLTDEAVLTDEEWNMIDESKECKRFFKMVKKLEEKF